MNPGMFGLSSGLSDSVPIFKYVQTQPILTSQQVQVPSGTKRIEALMAGGGGGGSGGTGGNGTGGGFGGLAIMLIPVTGAPLDIIIGAGGSGTTGSIASDGSPSKILSANTLYAIVGGGGGGVDQSNVPKSGTWGGAPGGTDLTHTAAPGISHGSLPPFGTLLWHPYPHAISNAITGMSGTGSTTYNFQVPPQPGQGVGSRALYNGSSWVYLNPTLGSNGGGPGCSYATGITLFGCGGNNTLAAGEGAGAGLSGGTGGSFTSVSVWGYTGGANGTNTAQAGGGGGGLLGSGGASTTGPNVGGAGARGAGGGGAYAGTGGNGGDGFVILRFYM